MFNFFNKKMSEISITGLITIGKYAEALKLIDEVLQQDENNEAMLYQKGICLYNLKKYIDAAESLKKAMKLKKDYRNAIVVLGNCERAVGNNEKAIDLYKQADKLKKLNRRETITYVKTLEIVGKYKDALSIINDFQNIIPVDFLDMEVQKIKIELFIKIAKPRDALYILEKIDPINIQKDITLDIYKADALLSLNRLDEAIFIIEVLMKKIPRSSYVKSLYSRLLIKQNKYEAALKLVEEGIKSNPKDEKLHLIDIDLLIKLEKYKDALITLEGASNLISKDAYINYKSKIFLEMNNIEKAMEYNNKAIKENPESPQSYIISAEIKYKLFKQKSSFSENNSMTNKSINIDKEVVSKEEDFSSKDFPEEDLLKEALENLNKASTLAKNIEDIEKIKELKEKILINL